MALNCRLLSLLPPGTTTILAVEFFQRTAYYGTVFAFTSYCLVLLGFTTRLANLVFYLVFSISPLSALVCSLLADAKFGRPNVLIATSLAYLLGFCLVTLSAVPYLYGAFPEDPKWYTQAIFSVGALVLAVGYGGYKVCAGPLMADCVVIATAPGEACAECNHQKCDDHTPQSPSAAKADSESQRQLSTSVLLSQTFSLHYWLFNVGAVIGLSAFQYARRLDSNVKTLHEADGGDAREYYCGYFYTFALSAGCSAIGLVIFLLRRSHFPHRHAGSGENLLSLPLLWIALLDVIRWKCCCQRHYAPLSDEEASLLDESDGSAGGNGGGGSNGYGSTGEDNATVQQGRSASNGEDAGPPPSRSHNASFASAGSNREERREKGCAVVALYSPTATSRDTTSGEPQAAAVDTSETAVKVVVDSSSEIDNEAHDSNSDSASFAQRRASLRRDVRQTLYACRIFFVLPLHWLCQSQTGGNMIIQAMCLEMPAGIPPVLLNNVSSLALLTAIPVINWAYALMANRRKRAPADENHNNTNSAVNPAGSGLPRVSTRMCIGFLISVLAMLNGIHVQMRIDAVAEMSDSGKCTLRPGHQQLPSGLWLLPSYVLGGIGQAFADPSAVEAAYALAPVKMKSVVMACYWLSSSLSGWGGVLMVPLDVPRLFIILYGSLASALFVATVGWTAWIRASGV